MALQFDPAPYLELFRQRQAEKARNRFDIGPVIQGVSNIVDSLGENKRKDALMELEKQKMGREARSSELAELEHQYKYGKPIGPDTMIGTPGGQGSSRLFGNQPMNVGTSSPLIDAFNKFRSGGMKPAEARPEFIDAMGEDERKAFMEQSTPEYQADVDYKRSQTLKNMADVGGGAKPEKAPPGYRWKPDGSLEAIPGGPAEAKIQSAQEKKDFALKGMKDQADLVISKVDQALSKVGRNTAGIGGALLGNIPGTEATDLESDLSTIKAILGFNTLTEMRKASPTGGALGQVSDREIKLLTAARASLEREQSPQQLRARLNEIKTHYQNWLLTVQGINPDESGMTGGGAESKNQSGQKMGYPQKVGRFTIETIEVE